MGTNFRPPTYSPRLQRHLAKLRKQYEGLERPVVSKHVAPRPGAPQEEDEQGRMERILAGLGALQQNISTNIRDLPVALAVGGPVGQKAANWMHRSPQSWMRKIAPIPGVPEDPSVPPPVSTPELAQDTYVGRVEATDAPAMQHAKAAARGVVGKTVDIASDPTNLALIAATHGASQVFPVVGKVANVGFGAMMLKGAYDSADHAYQTYREEGWSPAVSQAAAESAVEAGLVFAPLAERGLAIRSRGRIVRELDGLGVPPETTRGLTTAELRKLRDQMRGQEPKKDLPEEPPETPPEGPPPEGPPPPEGAPPGTLPFEPRPGAPPEAPPTPSPVAPFRKPKLAYEPPAARAMSELEALEQLRRIRFRVEELGRSGTPEAEAARMDLNNQADDLLLGLQNMRRSGAIRDPLAELENLDLSKLSDRARALAEADAATLREYRGGWEPGADPPLRVRVKEPTPPGQPPSERMIDLGDAASAERNLLELVDRIGRPQQPKQGAVGETAQDAVAEILRRLDGEIAGAKDPAEITSLTKMREALAEAQREVNKGRVEPPGADDPIGQAASDAELVNLRGRLTQEVQAITDPTQRTRVELVIDSIDAQLRQPGRLHGPPAPPAEGVLPEPVEGPAPKPPPSPPPTEVPPVVEGAAVPAPAPGKAPPARPAPPTERPGVPPTAPQLPPGEAPPAGPRVPPTPGAPDMEEAGPAVRGDIGRGPGGEGWVVRFYDREGREAMPPLSAPTKAKAKEILKGAKTTLQRNRREERKVTLSPEEGRVVATDPVTLRDEDSFQLALEAYAAGRPGSSHILKSLRSAKQLGAEIHPSWLEVFPLLSEIETTGKRTPIRKGELDPQMSPEDRAEFVSGERIEGAEAADLFFVSGQSRPRDIAAAAQMERPFGVDVGELSKRGVDEIAAAVGRMGANVFVDSGAYSLFKKGLRAPEGVEVEPLDFGKILQKYDELLDRTATLADPEERTWGTFNLVMPDVVGDQAATLEALAAFAPEVQRFLGQAHVNPIFPLQKGDLSLFEMWQAVAQHAGTQDFTVGIPGNAAAVTPEEVGEFVRQAKEAGTLPPQIHFLGVGPGARLEELVDAVRDAGPMDPNRTIPVTADANLVRSMMTPGVARVDAQEGALGAPPGTLEGGAPPLEQPGVRGLPESLQKMDPVQRLEYVALVEAGINQGQDTPEKLMAWAEEQLIVEMPADEAQWHLERFAEKPPEEAEPEEEYEEEPEPPPPPQVAPPAINVPRGTKVKKVNPKDRDAYIEQQGGDTELYKQNTYKPMNGYDPVRKYLKILRAAEANYPDETAYLDAIRAELDHNVRFYAIITNNPEVGELALEMERNGNTKRHHAYATSVPDSIVAAWDELSRQRDAHVVDGQWTTDPAVFFRAEDAFEDLGVDVERMKHRELELGWARIHAQAEAEGLIEDTEALYEILQQLGGFERFSRYGRMMGYETDPEWFRKDFQYDAIQDAVAAKAVERTLTADGEGYAQAFVPAEIVSEIVSNPPAVDEAVVQERVKEAIEREKAREETGKKKPPRKKKPKPKKEPKPKTLEDQLYALIGKHVEDVRRMQTGDKARELIRLTAEVRRRREDLKTQKGRKAKREYEEKKLELEGISGGFENYLGMVLPNAGAREKIIRLIKRIAKERVVVPKSRVKADGKFLPITQRTIDSAVDHLDIDPAELEAAVEQNRTEITVPEDVVLGEIERDAEKFAGMAERGELEDVLAYNVVTKAWDRAKKVKIRWKFHFADIPGMGEKTIKMALQSGPGHPQFKKILDFRTRKLAEGRAIEEALADMKPDYFDDPDALAALESIGLALEEDLQETPEPAGRPALAGDNEGQFADGTETHLLKTFMWGLKKPGTQESFTTQEVIDAIRRGKGQEYVRIVHAFRDAVNAEGGEADDVPFDVPEGGAAPGEGPVESTPAKPYGEQRYAWAVPVKVTWEDGSVHHDAVKGLNPGHALYRARENWPDAIRVEVDELGLHGLVEAKKQPYGRVRDKSGQELIPGYTEATMETPIITEGNLPGSMFSKEEQQKRDRAEKGEEKPKEPGQMDLFGGLAEAPRPLGGRYGPRPVRPTKKQLDLFERPAKPVDRPATPSYSPRRGPAAAGGPGRGRPEPQPAPRAGVGREADRQPAPGGPPGVDRRGRGLGGVERPPEVQQAPGAAPRAGIYDILTIRPEATDAIAPDFDLIPADLKPHLNSAQHVGVAKALAAMDKGEGFLMADGTGVGKTRQVLAVAARYARQGKKVLILAPAEVLKAKKRQGAWTISGSYVDDGAQMGVSLKFLPSSSRGKPAGELDPGVIHISTYYKVAHQPVDENTILISDEAHKFKSAFASQTGQAGINHAAKAAAVLFATATPGDKPIHLLYLDRIGIREGKPQDQFMKDLGMTAVKQKFRLKDPKTGEWKDVTKTVYSHGASKKKTYRLMEELFERVTRKGNIIRREIDMTGMDIQFRDVPLGEETKEMLDRIAEAKWPNRAVMLQHQRRQQEPDKLPAAQELIQSELAAGRSVVVFAARVNFSEAAVKTKIRDLNGEELGIEKEVIASSEGTLKLLRSWLQDQNIPYAEVHGAAEKGAAEEMDRFQSGQVNVMIATPEAGGTGINLDDRTGSRPRTMIVITAPFDSINNVQMVGRIHRVTTKSQGRVIYLFSDQAVDDWNKSIIGTKMKMLGAQVSGNVGLLDPGEMSEFGDPGQPDPGADRKKQSPLQHIARSHLETLIRNRGQDVVSLKQFRFIRRRLQALGAIFDDRHDTLGKYGDFTIETSDGEPFTGRLIPPEGDIGPAGYVSYAGPGEELPKREKPDPKIVAEPAEMDDVLFEMNQLASGANKYKGRRQTKPLVSIKQNRFIYNKLKKLGAVFTAPVGDPRNSFQIKTSTDTIYGKFHPFRPAAGNTAAFRGLFSWAVGERPSFFGVEAPRRKYGTDAAIGMDELFATLDEFKDWRDFHVRHDKTLASLFGNDAMLFRAILGITSQAADVRANVALAVKAYQQMRLGEPFKGYLPAVRRNLERLRSSNGVRGQKIRPYTRAELGFDAIAVDRHIARFVLGRENLQKGNSPNGSQVKFIQDLLRQAADELGWTGDEVASAVWAAQQIRGDSIPPEEVMTYDTVLQRHATAIRRFRSYFGDVAGPGGRVDDALSALAESGRDPVQIALDFLGDRDESHDPEDLAEIGLDWVERVVGPPGQLRPYRIGTGIALEDLGASDTPKHLGASIREAFFKEGQFDLDGMKVNSIEDLGLLGQLLRNPAFETSYIFPVKDGEILESWAETIRLPAAAPATPRPDDWTDWKQRLGEKLDAVGAEGFYAFHNHPSGNPVASVSDINITGVLLHLFGDRFLGQVVVDHGTFTVMDPHKGDFKANWRSLAQFMGLRHAYVEGDITDEQAMSLSMELTNPQRLKARAHEWIKYAPSIRRLPDPFMVKDRANIYKRKLAHTEALQEAVPEALALRAAETQAADQPLIMFLDVEYRIRQIASVPVDFFNESHRMRRWIINQGRAIGADNAVLIIDPGNLSVLRTASDLIKDGYALDGVVSTDPVAAETLRTRVGAMGQGIPFWQALPRLEQRSVRPEIFVAEERQPYRRRGRGVPPAGGGGDDGDEPPGPFNWPDREGPGTRWWNRRVAYARARMRARWGEAAMGFDPRWFWDAVVLGADSFARGIRSFSRWLISMGDVKDRTLLQRVWEYLQSIARPQYRETIKRGKPTDVTGVRTPDGRPRGPIRPIPEPSKKDLRAMLKWLESMMVPDPGTGKPPEFNWKGERIGLSTNITRISNERGIRDFITQSAHALESKFGEARSYRSWREAKEMALELGWTEREFVKALKEKGALTDYEIIAGRILRQEAGIDFINKQQAYRDAKTAVAEAQTPQEKAARQQTALELEREMHAALQKAIGIQYATVAAGSEAGRALAAHRMWIESLTPEERFLQRMMRGRKPGDQLIDELAAAIHKQDMAAVNQIYRQIHKPTRLDQFLEYWINSILSGPATQGANITGNLVHEALLRTPERGIASALEQRGVRQAIERFLTGEARPQERVPGEMMEAARALGKYRFGLVSAFKLAKTALVREDIGFGVKGEYRPPAIPGRFGKLVRTPGRIMEALDVGAKYAAASAERSAQVFRKAALESRGQGWTREQLLNRMKEINQSLDKYLEIEARRQIDPREVSKEDVSFLLRNKELGKIKKEMEHAADVSTFRDETTLFSKYIQLLRGKYPWLTFVVPFIRTPERILIQAVRRTPVGLARTVQNIRSGKLKGGEASDRLAQGILGSFISAGVYMMAKDGLITGGGPAEWDERRNWLATGKQPYAIKIGNTWVSMARIEPIATSLGFAADLAEATDERIAGDIWDKLHYSVMNNITGKTYLEGMVSAAEAVGDPDRYGARFFKRMVGAMIPNLLASAARSIDPTIRQTDDISSTLIARVPWFSQNLPPKLTGTGEPIQRGEDPFSRFASPFRYSPEAGPERNLERLFLETGYTPNAPPRFMSIPGAMGRKIALNQRERELYAAYAARASAFARNLTSNSDWDGMDIYAKTEFLKRIYRFAHDAARREIHRSIMARIATGEYELKRR